jgi:hypothetical protein
VSRIFEEFPHPTIQTKIVQHFSRKICQKTRRLEAFLNLSAQNCLLFTKTQYQNKKIKTFCRVDDLSEAYPMIPFSCRSNLAGRYL